MTLLIEAATTASHHARSATLLDGAGDLAIALHGEDEIQGADEVQLDGASYRPHPNGGGLVALTAFVGADVFVARTAQVRGNAIVVGTAKILDRAIVRDHATISDRCHLYGDSIVEGLATLIGMVTLRRHARIGGTARLEGGIVVDCHTTINRGHLFGPLSIG